MVSNGSKADAQELGKKGDFTPRVRKAERTRYENWEEEGFLQMLAISWGTQHVN